MSKISEERGDSDDCLRYIEECGKTLENIQKRAKDKREQVEEEFQFHDANDEKLKELAEKVRKEKLKQIENEEEKMREVPLGEIAALHSSLHFRKGDFAKSIEILNRSRVSLLLQKDVLGGAKMQQQLAMVLIASGEAERGVKYMSEAVEMIDKLDTEIPVEKLRARRMLAEAYKRAGSFNEAIQVYNVVISYSQSQKIPNEECEAYIGTAEAFAQVNFPLLF